MYTRSFLDGTFCNLAFSTRNLYRFVAFDFAFLMGSPYKEHYGIPKIKLTLIFCTEKHLEAITRVIFIYHVETNALYPVSSFSLQPNYFLSVFHYFSCVLFMSNYLPTFSFFFFKYTKLILCNAGNHLK